MSFSFRQFKRKRPIKEKSGGLKKKGRLPLEELKLKEIRKGKRFLGYTPTFKDFVKKNKSLLLTTFKLIKENERKLINGEPIEEGKIRIQKAATGSQKGGHRRLTLKVDVAEKEFFVKITSGGEGEGIIKDFRRMQHHLKTKNHEINKFKVYLIKPHFIYDGYGDKTYIVTDFYNAKKVIQVADIKNYKIKDKILKAINELDKQTSKSFDLTPLNAFYQPKTKTILIYDIKILS